MPKTPYHHGNLRAELIRVTLEVIEREGPTGVSLRAVAKHCGVSHGAPAHHFGDKAGLLTVVAAEGFGLLADALAQAREETDDFAEVGVAYVRFAVDHRAQRAGLAQGRVVAAGRTGAEHPPRADQHVEVRGRAQVVPRRGLVGCERLTPRRPARPGVRQRERGVPGHVRRQHDAVDLDPPLPLDHGTTLTV